MKSAYSVTFDIYCTFTSTFPWPPLRKRNKWDSIRLMYKALNGLSSQPLAADDFDRLMLLPATFHEPAQLWAIDPSLLLVHICGKIHHFISVTLNYRFSSFVGY